jgi:hypothetical protein
MGDTVQRAIRITCACLALLTSLAAPRAVEPHAGPCSCTAAGSCSHCVPACSATWRETKTKKPKYTMTCEYACARGRDSWHAPDPGCRCSPPCGNVFVKKRFYKADGEETVERIPQYEVKMVPAEPCGCTACRGAGLCWWNPFSLLPALWDR